MKHRVTNKINEIIAELRGVNIQNDIGILSGNSGIAMFFLQYYQMSGNDKYFECIQKSVIHAIESINKGNNKFTFCGGITGLLWLVEDLICKKLIDEKDIEFIDELENFLCEKMTQEMANGNYDYLHGSSGIALYFAKKNRRKDTSDFIEKYIRLLCSKADYFSDGSIAWKSIVNIDKQNVGYNLSLSHGLASIICILSKIFLSGYKTEKVEETIRGCVKYINKNKLKDNSKSFFPNWITLEDQNTFSRLAWCYGDLGIAISLYYASKALEDINMENSSLEIFCHAALRRNLQDNHIVDAGICHGTAGISHIFRRMFINTGLSLFTETADYWLDQTLKMAIHNDGLAGFKAYHGEKYGGWVKEYSILEGISGIGLMLISSINDCEPTWDECLLLS